LFIVEWRTKQKRQKVFLFSCKVKAEKLQREVVPCEGVKKLEDFVVFCSIERVRESDKQATNWVFFEDDLLILKEVDPCI